MKQITKPYYQQKPFIVPWLVAYHMLEHMVCVMWYLRAYHIPMWYAFGLCGIHFWPCDTIYVFSNQRKLQLCIFKGQMDKKKTTFVWCMGSYSTCSEPSYTTLDLSCVFFLHHNGKRHTQKNVIRFWQNRNGRRSNAHMSILFSLAALSQYTFISTFGLRCLCWEPNSWSIVSHTTQSFGFLFVLLGV